jgi:hypothetical protein
MKNVILIDSSLIELNSMEGTDSGDQSRYHCIQSRAHLFMFTSRVVDYD